MDWTRVFLIVYSVLFFTFGFLLRWVLVQRWIGKSPQGFGKSDNVFDYVSKVFGRSFMLVLVPFVIYVFLPRFYGYLAPFSYLESETLAAVAAALLSVSLVLIVWAQHTMGKSWRMGIDQEIKTELIEAGPFKFSRNPIFAGMIVSAWAFFLFLPNAITLVSATLATVIINIQIRLEEEHLQKLHAKKYEDFCKRVSRFF